MFIRIALLLLLSVFGGLPLCAIPAYPKKIPVRIDNETVYIRLFGDEYRKHAETLDGYTIIQKDDQWYYAEKDDEGYLKASSHILSSKSDAETSVFLEKTQKHLSSDHKSQRRRAQTRDDNDDNDKRAVIGEKHVLVILMQFKDLEFTKSREEFNHLFNTINYSEDGARGSVYDFYNDVSYGKLQLRSDIIGPFTSKNDRSYYGANNRDGDDKNPEELFFEAMEYASGEVDFHDYDSDKDGYIDNVHIIYAGHGEEAGASSNAIWAHEATYDIHFLYQGMKIDRYSCAPELRGANGTGISRIGPHCHEIGHALGALDYYDTNYGGQGNFEGTGVWDVMASGSWNADGVIPADFNPYVKMEDFGWIEVEEMPEGEVTLQPSSLSDLSYYRLTNTYNDYYLVENRTMHKWGEALPGSGLLIFHIHPNVTNVGNEINATYPQKCYPVCASSNYDIPNSQPKSYGDINSEGCPFPGTSRNTQFNRGSIPSAFSWVDDMSFVDIRNIRQNADMTVSLSNLSQSTETAVGMMLFHEEFENPRKYESVFEQGETSWYRIEVDNSKKGKTSVSPHSGVCYLRFEPNKFATSLQQSSVTFSSAKASEKNPASLSFYYQGVSYRPDELILQVSYKCDEGEWETSDIVSNGKPGWKNYVVLLPDGETYQLRLSAFAAYGQAVYVDDIEILQRQTTRINDSPKSATNSYAVFDLFGRKLPEMVKGLNIVRKSDGTVRKILVK